MLGSVPVMQPACVARTRKLKKSYGDIVALRDLNLELRAANCWPCWDRTARARPRWCSAAWTGPP